MLCSVRGCQEVYHLLCAKESLGFHNLGKFRCPQHVRSSCVLDRLLSIQRINSSVGRLYEMTCHEKDA